MATKTSRNGGDGMKINKITYQHRRDFEAVYECGGAGTPMRAEVTTMQTFTRM